LLIYSKELEALMREKRQNINEIRSPERKETFFHLIEIYTEH